MNCQEALNLLYDIIDNEASEIDEQAVREHLAHCRHCREIYRVEGIVNDFLHARIQENTPPERLDGLRSRILHELDDLDDGTARAKKKLPNHRLTRFLAAAAALVLLVGAALLGSSMIKDHEDMVALEQAHWATPNNLHQYTSPSLTQTASVRTINDYHYDLSPRVSDFLLLGGAIETIEGVEMTHFVFSDGSKYVSVFVAPASEFSVPDSLTEHAVTRGELQFYDHICQGCRLVFHRIGDAIVITATTEKDVDLLDFVPGRSAI